MEEALLAQLDTFVISKGFQNRSQAIRSIVRQSLLQNVTQKEILTASIEMPKNALASRFGQVLNRCERWGIVKSFTTVFLDMQTVSIYFTIELASKDVEALKNDPILKPISIHMKGSDPDEINI